MPGKLEDLLFQLEERFWTAGADFHMSNLADAAVMVLPGPAGVLVKDEIMRSLGRQAPCTHVALEEHRVLQLGDAAAIVTYRAAARRQGSAKPYIVRASSAYVHDGRRWRLAFHQQTPP
jgi:hypothetical protein